MHPSWQATITPAPSISRAMCRVPSAICHVPCVAMCARSSFVRILRIVQVARLLQAASTLFVTYVRGNIQPMQLELYRTGFDMALVLVGTTFIMACVFYELEVVSSAACAGTASVPSTSRGTPPSMHACMQTCIHGHGLLRLLALHDSGDVALHACMLRRECYREGGILRGGHTPRSPGWSDWQCLALPCRPRWRCAARRWSCTRPSTGPASPSPLSGALHARTCSSWLTCVPWVLLPACTVRAHGPLPIC